MWINISDTSEMCVTSFTIPLLPVATVFAQCECRLGFLSFTRFSLVSFHRFRSECVAHRQMSQCSFRQETEGF